MASLIKLQMLIDVKFLRLQFLWNIVSDISYLLTLVVIISMEEHSLKKM
jgi:hypothetical protein